MNRPMFRPAPVVLAIALALGVPAVHAQQGASALLHAPVPLRIAAQPLGQALNDWAHQTRIDLIAPPALVADRAAPAVAGTLTPAQALERLLAGSGLVAVPDGQAVVVRAASGESGASTSALPAVVVEAEAERESATGPVRGYLARRSATGTKTDTPIIETPQSISVVTADRVQAIGAISLKDALDYSAGVGTARFGSDSRYDWISVRGFDAYRPGFYMDGLPLRNNGTFAVWRTENYGAERIEVLRGPSSVLYGLGNPGGVVNVVSKRPTAEPLRELQLQLGNYDRRQVAADFSGPIDSEGKLLYRLTGVLRDAQLPAAKMADDHSYIAPSLTWKPSSDTTLTLLSQFSRVRAGAYTRIRPAAGSLVPSAIGTWLPPSLFTGDPGLNHLRQDQDMIGYQFEHRIDDTWTVRQNARYGRLKMDFAQLQAPAFATLNADVPNDPANFQFLSRTILGSREKLSAFAIDNQVQGDFRHGDWQHKLLAGLDYQRTRIDAVSVSGGSAPLLSIYAPVYGGAFELPAPYGDGTQRVTQAGLYLQDQIKWRDSWLLTLGGRYDHATSDTHNRLDRTNARAVDHKFTSRVGLVYLAPDGWAPYLSYAESFGPAAAVNPDTGAPYKPETGRQYEAGIRYQPPGRKQSYSAAIFDLRRKNYITYDAESKARQVGEVSVRGLELEATAELASRLNLTASYSYTPRAIVTASANPEQIGKQMTAVPRNRLSVWADYRFAGGLKFGLGARHIGSTRGDGESAPVPLRAVTLVDAMVGYDIEHWSLALHLRNLTNKTYIANCNGGNCYYGYPRTAVATATYRW